MTEEVDNKKNAQGLDSKKLVDQVLEMRRNLLENVIEKSQELGLSDENLKEISKDITARFNDLISQTFREEIGDNVIEYVDSLLDDLSMIRWYLRRFLREKSITLQVYIDKMRRLQDIEEQTLRIEHQLFDNFEKP